MDQSTSSSPQSIVIIGSGLAGYTLIREVRKLNKDIPITLITKEPGYFYSKPMLSTALAGKKEAAQLISTQAEGMASQLAIHILANTNVIAIDSANKMIKTSNGDVMYGELILALGADQLRVPIQGNAAHEVMTVNDLEDYSQFRNAIHNKKRIAILGAGLIGCEFANDLVLGGYEIDVVDMAPHALGRLIPEVAASALQTKLSALGVCWHFGASMQSVDRVDNKLKITLTNGKAINSDAVLSAIGLKPRLELAQRSGIATGAGILVNRVLETNLPHIYALGDCAEVEGLVLPYVMPIMQAARALAQTLIGQRTELSYPAMPVMVKTPAFTTIVAPPAKDAVGQWKINALEDGLEARFEANDGRLLGFVLMGSATAQRAALTKELPAILA